MENQIKYFILAMFIQVMFPMITLIVMFRRKTKAVKEKKVRARHFKLNVNDINTVPEDIIQVNNHYQNLFEMPLLFLIGASLMIHFKFINHFTVTLAWLFVITRMIHTIVHLGANYIPYRYISFGISCLVLSVMWFYIIGKIFLA